MKEKNDEQQREGLDFATNILKEEEPTDLARLSCVPSKGSP